MKGIKLMWMLKIHVCRLGIYDLQGIYNLCKEMVLRYVYLSILFLKHLYCSTCCGSNKSLTVIHQLPSLSYRNTFGTSGSAPVDLSPFCPRCYHSYGALLCTLCISFPKCRGIRFIYWLLPPLSSLVQLCSCRDPWGTQSGRGGLEKYGWHNKITRHIHIQLYRCQSSSIVHSKCIPYYYVVKLKIC